MVTKVLKFIKMIKVVIINKGFKLEVNGNKGIKMHLLFSFLAPFSLAKKVIF